MQQQQSTEILYEVVINDELQYSIWQSDKALPPGWKIVGKLGSKESCLAYIKDHWTDMRPRSLQLNAQDI